MNGPQFSGVLLAIFLSIAFSQLADAQALPPQRYITVEGIVGALQAARVKARLLPSQLPKALVEEVGIDDLIENTSFEMMLFKCDPSHPDAVCKIGFSATLKVDAAISEAEISRLNHLSTLKIFAVSPAGKPPGLNMGYTYPCMGVTDANLASMALTFFGFEANSVISNYKNGLAAVQRKNPDAGSVPK